MANFDLRSVDSHNQHKEFQHIFMQILTLEAARAEIINKDFTSPETLLPLLSFDQSVQRLPQHSPRKQKERESPLVIVNISHLNFYCKTLNV